MMEPTFSFKAKIYKIGINWCVDVPGTIVQQLPKDKGYIRVKGHINGFEFFKNLVPVKDAPYRLFVNGIMMKGAQTAVGKTAHFELKPDGRRVEKQYPFPTKLKTRLSEEGLLTRFKALSPSRQKDILKYLSYIKTPETSLKNVNKLVLQLKAGHADVRIP